MNARMYSVTPTAEAEWRALLGHITVEAGVSLDYFSYPAPQPLELLWSRPDLGCVLMCGFPVALGLAPVVPIAAPIPRAAWAVGRPMYRTDLIARKDSPFRTLEDTFGGSAGWTVAHSHSGFNAWRHHLLGYRTPARPSLYARMEGNLTGRRGILDAVKDGLIDVGPLDSYWHMLLARYDPEATAGVRVLATTGVAPMPAFVAAASAPPELVTRLRAAFVAAAGRDWFAPLGEALMIDGFAAVDRAQYATTLEWDREARAAGYDLPA